MSEQDAMTKSQVIQAVLDRLDGLIALEEFIWQVLVLSPSQAKDPGATIRNELRYDGARRIVFLDKKTLLPVRLVMNGLRFRITLTRQEVEHGVVGIFPWFVPFMVKNPFQLDPGEFRPRFCNEQDKEIPYQPAKLRQRMEGLWGPETTQVPAFVRSIPLVGPT